MKLGGPQGKGEGAGSTKHKKGAQAITHSQLLYHFTHLVRKGGNGSPLFDAAANPHSPLGKNKISNIVVQRV